MGAVNTERAGWRVDQNQTWHAGIRIEQPLELLDRVQVGQLYSYRSRFMEQGRIDGQPPGNEDNDSEHQQVAHLQNAKCTRRSEEGFSQI